jgi:hypothetical protein
MAMELKTKNQRLAPHAKCFSLPDAPNIEVFFCDTSTGAATAAARCGSFMGKAFSLLVVSSRCMRWI